MASFSFSCFSSGRTFHTTRDTWFSCHARQWHFLREVRSMLMAKIHRRPAACQADKEVGAPNDLSNFWWILVTGERSFCLFASRAGKVSLWRQSTVVPVHYKQIVRGVPCPKDLTIQIDQAGSNSWTTRQVKC